MESNQYFEHNGKALQLTAYESKPAAKAAKTSSRAPGAAKFEIAALQLSATQVSAGEEITLSARVHGKNIAYIYSEILLKDPNSDQYYGPVQREYLRAGQDQENSGINYPVWDETINISVGLRLSLPLITDGVTTAFGFRIPEAYRKAVFHMDGLYNEKLRARLIFDGDGALKNSIGYKKHGMRFVQREMQLEKGDRFAPFVSIFGVPKNDEQNWHVGTALSTPLTLGEQAFRCEADSPIAGEYLIGLLIQDLDGGFTRKYAPLPLVVSD